MPDPIPNANKVALLPEPTTLDAPFWDGLRAGELQLQHCAGCGAFQYPPETFCYECGSNDLQWEAASGGGTVYSFITVHQRYHAAFADNLPYNVSVIELDEGPRLISNVIDIPSDEVEVGMRVKAAPRDLDGERSWLYFERA